MAQTGFGDLVKAVVDVALSIMAVDGELHSDEETLLLEQGAERIEFDSMINIRPSQGNRSRGVEDSEVQARIVSIVDALVAS